MPDVVIGDPRPSGEEGPAGDQREAGADGPAGDPRPGGEATMPKPKRRKSVDDAEAGA